MGEKEKNSINQCTAFAESMNFEMYELMTIKLMLHQNKTSKLKNQYALVLDAFSCLCVYEKEENYQNC